MKNCYGPLPRITLVTNSLVLLLSFTGVTCAPVTTSIMSFASVMRNDSKLCESSKFLVDSTYVQKCADLPYPVSPIVNIELQLGTLLCLGMYDTAYKICQYSSQHLIPMNISAIFDSHMKQQLDTGRESEIKKVEFCNSLRGYNLHNKTYYLWEPLVKNINAPEICVKACFDYSNKLEPLCAVLGWIKSIDDIIKKANKAETKHDSVVPGSQLNDETATDGKTIPIGPRITSEIKETKEQAPNSSIAVPKDKSKVKVDNLPITSGDAMTAAPKAVDTEEIRSETVKANKNEIQKKINKTDAPRNHKLPAFAVAEEEKESVLDRGTNAEGAKNTPAKNVPANGNPQTASVKNLADNAPNKDVASQGNTREKELVIDNYKTITSTISENTQDQYDVNPEEDVESNRGENIDGTSILIKCLSARFVF